MTRKPSRIVLAAALFALSVLFSVWFHDDHYRVATLLLFTFPPLAMLVAVLRGGAKAAFWSGVLGLLWFCHGVMAAWLAVEAVDRSYAWGEIALAVTIVCAASWPGVRARFGGRKPSR